MFSFLYMSFVVLVGLLAAARTHGTWGPPAGIGLGAALLALILLMPLGSILALGAATGALVACRKEEHRRLTG